MITPRAIAETLKQVSQKIFEAAKRSGRSGQDVKLVAVTKTVPLEIIKQAVAAGVSAIGENRIQEAKEKLISKKELPAEWHFIGHLQTNKAKTAVTLFDMIQSLDSHDLARVLDRHAAELGKIQDCLVELKVSEEPAKFGVIPEQLLDFLQDLQSFSHLRVKGLMAMAPYFDQPESARPYFQKARKAFEQAKSLQMPHLQIQHLSMGMSQDFKVAIEEGATMVRIGTALFEGFYGSF